MELMIVMAIIGVLMMVAVPSFVGSQGRPARAARGH
jgi:type II secretory pathway pseudopilin PulG